MTNHAVVMHKVHLIFEDRKEAEEQAEMKNKVMKELGQKAYYTVEEVE